jgi:hypothetical protein
LRRSRVYSIPSRERAFAALRPENEDAPDLIGSALKDGKAMLIDVGIERGYKPM